MQQQKIAAFLVEAGSSLEYFTGIAGGAPSARPPR